MSAAQTVIASACFVLCLSGPALAQRASCPVDGALYRPISSEGPGGSAFEAEFRVQKPVIANQAPYMLIMREKTGKRTHTFEFFQPNGYGQTMISLQAPAKTDTRKDPAQPEGEENEQEGTPNASALFFDANLATIDPLFDKAPSAPAYMLFADLGKAFWYSMLEDARTFLPPRGLWKRVNCKK